jgi:hypothetical protein
MLYFAHAGDILPLPERSNNQMTHALRKVVISRTQPIADVLVNIFSLVSYVMQREGVKDVWFGNMSASSRNDTKFFNVSFIQLVLYQLEFINCDLNVIPRSVTKRKTERGSPSNIPYCFISGRQRSVLF